MTHTALPWTAIDNRILSDAYVLKGAPIATVHAREANGMQKANAAFIVRACNEYEATKAAMQVNLNRAVRAEELLSLLASDFEHLRHKAGMPEANENLLGEIREVLAKTGA